MPLEDSMEIKKVPVEKSQEEFDRVFGKLLKQITVDPAADILTNEDKFSLIVRKTNNLIHFAGNKFIWYLKTSNNNKLSYITIDDYSQEAKMVLWDILEKNPNKPLIEILKIFKTALWRITSGYLRKSNLKKNLGLDVNVATTFSDNEEIALSDSFDNLVHQYGENKNRDNKSISNIDREEIKEKFSEYLVNTLDIKDAQIFNLIAHPQDDFINYCRACCCSKKKKHKDIISQSNIASYLNVSICYVHNRIKKITKAFSEFKESNIDR